MLLPVDHQFRGPGAVGDHQRLQPPVRLLPGGDEAQARSRWTRPWPSPTSWSIAGSTRCCLSGGEPLLFRGVEHVMRRLVDGGVLVKLLTNGTVENEAVYRMIEEDPSIEVSLSVLSVRPEKADAIFRPGRRLGQAVRHARPPAAGAGQHHHRGQHRELRRGRGDPRLGRGPGHPRHQRHQRVQGPDVAGPLP